MAISRSVVRAHSESPTKTVVKARGFTMVIDEPEEAGGTNEGLNPVEYLLGALSGCLNVVCHMVAKELGFELKDLKIDLKGSINSDKLMGVSDAQRAGFQEIEVIIKPEADADQETLEKWIKIVGSRCPVSDNISNETPVKISLK